MKKLLLILSLFIAGVCGAETIPSVPTKYFTDNSGLIAAPDAARFNERLAALEKQTTIQFVVYVSKFDTDSSIEDYCNRIAKEWKVGQKDKDNGIILFWFPDKKKLRFEIGYRMESYIPDVLDKRILDNQIIPEFKKKNYVAGLDAGINKVIETLNKEPAQVEQENAKLKENKFNGWKICAPNQLENSIQLLLNPN